MGKGRESGSRGVGGERAEAVRESIVQDIANSTNRCEMWDLPLGTCYTVCSTHTRWPGRAVGGGQWVVGSGWLQVILLPVLCNGWRLVGGEWWQEDK
jgi:hypothetical protein